MTVHVSVRSISALLLLSVSLLGLPAGAPAQSVVAPQKTAPTLAERLDRLAAEIDRNRIDLHVPGAVLAIVRGDDVIFARGFGVADIEKKTPVTTDTPFFIGSTTKAFTATLAAGTAQGLRRTMLGAESRPTTDSNIGFVVLTNTMSALPSIATQLVPQYLLSEPPPAASDAGDLKPYLGRYIANFATFWNEVFTISERNRRLVLDIPSRLESALNPPRADGRWPLVMTDQLAVSFDRDNTGRVVGMQLHEGALAFEIPRQGIVLTPEIPLSELQKYVGRYGDAAGANDFAILIRNQRLAVWLPNNTSFDLLPPDATGRRATRANVGLGVTFEESPTGAVAAMNVHRPGAAPVMRLTPVASSLPTVDEIMKLRRIPAASAIATMRTSGSVRFPQSAVKGRFSSSTAGDDRLRVDLDLDGSVQMRTVLRDGRASQAVSGAAFMELTGKALEQTRLGHPSVLFGDWRKYYDAVRVLRAGALGGRKVYGVQLESAGLPPTLVALDAETGDVLQTRLTISSGDAGAIAVTTTYSDYREVGGMRVPHGYIASNEMTGRTIFQVERVEVNVELPPDTFTLEPSTSPGSGR